MYRLRRASLVLAMIISSAASAGQASRFGRLPIGWQIVQDTTVPAQQAAAIGQKLGGRISELSNTVISANGERIQVNVIKCPSPADAQTIHNAIARLKSDPAFCLKLGNAVVEFVGNDVQLATKAAYELGFRPKPAQARFKITFEAAPIESGDYMSWNPLFQAFVDASGADSSRRIAELAGKFKFGNSIQLRYCGTASSRPLYSFTPQQTQAKLADAGEAVTLTFGELPKKQGIGYVTVQATVTTSAQATTPTRRSRTDPALVGPTEFWPSNDPLIVALSKSITTGCTGDSQKIQAILKWLRPNTNIRFGGPVTGSRYGVKQVLAQKFGHCWDFSDCFITLCRARNIPTRQVAGWLYGASGHVWAEVLLDNGNWLQVDPTGGGMLDCGIYYIPYITSEDGAMTLVYLSMPKIEWLK